MTALTRSYTNSYFNTIANTLPTTAKGKFEIQTLTRTGTYNAETGVYDTTSSIISYNAVRVSIDNVDDGDNARNTKQLILLVKLGNNRRPKANEICEWKNEEYKITAVEIDPSEHIAHVTIGATINV